MKSTNEKKADPKNISKENNLGCELMASPPLRIVNERYQEMLKRREQEKNRPQTWEK